MDANNEKGLTTPWYSKVLPYPFNFYYPGKYKRNAEIMIASLYENIDDEKDIKDKVRSKWYFCIVLVLKDLYLAKPR